MISKVELVLLLARGIVLIVAIVGLHGDETFVTRFHSLCGEVDGNGKIAAQVFFYKSAVDIDPLLAHDGLEMDDYLFAGHILRYSEVFAIPTNTLVISATTGLRGFQTVDMRGTDHLPLVVAEGRGLCTFDIAEPEAPPFIEIINDSSATL